MTCSPWATSADACAPCDDYALDPNLLDDSMQLASDILFNLTGRRWPGLCSDVIRPNADFRSGPSVPRWWPSSGTGHRWGWCSCHRGRETGCASVPEIKLPGNPASNVTVTIDGEAFEEFRVDDGRYLVRTDGEGWPCCQDMTLETDQVGTFEIAYDYGAEPPIGGVRAAATYGCQLALSCDPTAVQDGRCRLPKRVTSITRGGTTMALLDPMAFVEKGQVGLPDVDAWVRSILIGDSRRRATVIVPGRSRSVRRTTD